MNESGMSGFWGDLRDVGFDTGESVLKQLAAQKLANEGILRTSSSLAHPAVTAQPQRESFAPVVAPQSVASNQSDTWGDAGIVVLIVVMILLLRR